MVRPDFNKRTAVGALLAVLVAAGIGSGTARAHVFIFEFYRVGAYPPYDGSGWVGEAFLNIPDASAIHLLAAEAYVANRTPDFTFRTDWIDFPAGPVAYDLDANFNTIGDFLNDYIYDVSDPSKLDAPFGHFLLRFSGFLKVTLQDDVSFGGSGLPIWVEFGSMGYDGYRTRVFDTVYRIPIVNPANGFFHENSIVQAAGLFPIEITYFNRYDPQAQNNPPTERAGIELYSFHPGGLPWPAGENLVHPVFGPATIVPPRVIYQEEDILPLIDFDYDADSDVDLLDYQWLQTCYTGPAGDEPFYFDLGCSTFDSDNDQDVDLDDFSAFAAAFTGPAGVK